MKKIIQLIGVSLIIIVLPAASWYFLKSGLDYRKESMGQLGQYGQLPEMNLLLSNGQSVHTSRMDGMMGIVHTMNENGDTSLIMKLYRQFSKRTDLQFVLSDTESLKLMADRASNLWLLKYAEENIPFLEKTGVFNSGDKNVALIDINGEIRNHYNLNNISELQQMVEHTAFLLPVYEDAKPVMRRELEK